jgi:hypothetical protein
MSIGSRKYKARRALQTVQIVGRVTHLCGRVRQISSSADKRASWPGSEQLAVAAECAVKPSHQIVDACLRGRILRVVLRETGGAVEWR